MMEAPNNPSGFPRNTPSGFPRIAPINIPIGDCRYGPIYVTNEYLGEDPRRKTSNDRSYDSYYSPINDPFNDPSNDIYHIPITETSILPSDAPSSAPRQFPLEIKTRYSNQLHGLPPQIRDEYQT